MSSATQDSRVDFITPSTPSILGPSISRVPLSDITLWRVSLSDLTLWQMGTIQSCHVLGDVDLDRFKRAVAELARLYPVVAGRFKRDEKEGMSEYGEPNYEYYVELTSSPVPLTITTSSSTSPPFPSPSVIQPTLSPYVPSLDVTTQLNNPSSPLLSLQLTSFPSLPTPTTVLGLTWAHVIGDGHTFCTFTKVLSDLYEGKEVAKERWPTFEPHVGLFQPDEEMLKKWEHPILFPTYELGKGFGMYADAAEASDEVQFVLTLSEISRLKQLAIGPNEEDWVSEQDAMSAYFIGLLRLVGEPIESVVNSVNYRTLFPPSPSFPPNLPSLVANVAQLISTPLPPPSSSTTSTQLSLRPVAQSIRHTLSSLRSDPERALEWLSCRGYRMRQTVDKGETQVMVPLKGDSTVNSNWRCDWNHSFGFPSSTTSHHTTMSVINFLRVFRTNPLAKEKGAELTFRVKKGLKEGVEREVERDRREGWERWE